MGVEWFLRHQGLTGETGGSAPCAFGGVDGVPAGHPRRPAGDPHEQFYQ